MDQQFSELAVQITADVTAAVNKHVSEVEGRLAQQAQTNLETLQSGAQTHLETLQSGAQVHRETLQSQVQLAAEGYGGTLDGINRRLDAIESLLSTRFQGYDLVLKDHGDRIVALEINRSPEQAINR